MKNNILKYSSNGKAVKSIHKYHPEASKIGRRSQARAASQQHYHQHETAVTHPAMVKFVRHSKMQAQMEKKKICCLPFQS